jgi:anti-sigma-K factor RskA
VSADHRRHEEDLAAYMLGALSPGEARDFEDHLQSCAPCQAEERWLRGAVELLPSSVEQIAPPRALRKRLMETVRAAAAAGARSPSRPRLRFGSLRLAFRPVAAVGAAAVLAGAVIGYAIGEGGTKSSTSTVAARATAVQPQARATIVRSGDTAVLRAERLAPPGRDRVYEVWLVRKGSTRPEPSSLFQIRRDGSGEAGIDGSLHGVQQVMVTAEPAGGSGAPTTKPVLTATL